MARLRKGIASRKLERPYTRVSKYKKKAFIRVTPSVRVVRFTSGNHKKKFPFTLNLISKSDLNIRDNALESARQTSNRLLERTLGTAAYAMRVKVYPYHIIREHALATGAGADRFSSGMAHSFGKPVGNAARVKKGQSVFEVKIGKENLELARKALTRASKKIPCSCTIQVTKN
tara:strand:+ start:8595 stop:9116 length:522 start_codon:yes stop_codon:yes gene_type:complete